MKLIVISPEAEDSRELAALGHFFAAGLTHYHVRKPAWERDRVARWVRDVPEEFHPRLVLHSHHALAREFQLGGLHWRDGDAPPSSASSLCSCAVHDVAALRAASNRVDRILFSPMFPSFSKPGHAPDGRVSVAELIAALALPRRAEVFALGGIDLTRLSACGDLGFDGVAVLGAIWQAADPIEAFARLHQALPAHAA